MPVPVRALIHTVIRRLLFFLWPESVEAVQQKLDVKDGPYLLRSGRNQVIVLGHGWR
jgi:hypothetical protein